MSHATALLTDRRAPDDAPRRRGGQPVELDPEQRKLHTAVAQARLLFGRPVGEVARAFDISKRTVSLWTARALTYPGPLGDALRRAHGSAN